MGGAASRRKGHNFEREIARDLREIDPNARRGLQYRDGADCPDVHAAFLWVECKRGKKTGIRAAMRQAWDALRACTADYQGGKLAVAITKDDGEKALATMDYVDFLELYRAAHAWWTQ